MNNLKTNNEKIKAIIANTILNSFREKDYNFWNEALLWAKSKNYFPEFCSDEELLNFLRQYDEWNEFEKICVETGQIKF